MKLMTKELQAMIPELYGQEGMPGKQKKAYSKFFTPWSFWTWYMIEYDPEHRLCFGYVEGLESEFGYFSLDELENIKGPAGLTVERDLYFNPTLINDILKEVSHAV